MIKVLTVGVFDLFHVGHVNLLKQAKLHGDYLVVGVQAKANKHKPGVTIYYSVDERVAVVRSNRDVDAVIVYEDVDQLITQVEFDIFAKGPDQNHSGFQKAVEYCEANGKKVVEIPRTEGVSSTIIRKIYG